MKDAEVREDMEGEDTGLVPIVGSTTRRGREEETHAEDINLLSGCNILAGELLSAMSSKWVGGSYRTDQAMANLGAGL